ncbi:MAG: hypothetical protein JWO09_2594 [Bacteroidetes bacterium]|nr:hypothetical protein [Bacteroidota bacterium]
MRFIRFLKTQLIDFADTYERQFSKTYSIALVWSICAAAITLLLLKYTSFDDALHQRHNSLIGYFYFRYSTGSVYSLTDLTKIVFIFFISIFSLSLLRFKSSEPEISFSGALQTIKAEDLLMLLATLAAASFMDYIINCGIYNLPSSAYTTWFYYLLFHCRIYLPLIMFSYMVCKLAAPGKVRFTLYKTFLLFVALWLFNEFSYELYMFINNTLFRLVFASVETPDTLFILEGIFELFLIAFFFLGFHSAITSPLRMSPATESIAAGIQGETNDAEEEIAL